MISKSLKNVNDIYEEFIKTGKPQDTIMCIDEKSITLEEFQRNVDLFTKHLIKLGVQTGTVVGYTMPNCQEIFYLFIAISRLGGCAVPLFHMLPDMAKVDIFKKCKVQFVITKSQQFANLKESSDKMGAQYKIATIDESNAFYNFTMPICPEIEIKDYILAQTDPDLPILMASSSGTTGIPKSVIMTQSNFASEIHASYELVSPFNINGPDGFSSIMAFPLSTAGILTCLGALFEGVCAIFMTEISPVKFVQLLAYWKADTMSAPPAFYEAILTLPTLDNLDLSSIKRVMTGMDFFSPSLWSRLKAKFTGLNGFANGYGLTETSNVFMICKSIGEENPTSTTLMKLAENIGNAIEVRDEEGNCVPVGSEGELYVKGPNVVKGYVGNPEETQKSFNDGWFKTGDIVRYEGNNSITLLGRKKYLIKRGGKQISPIVVQDYINSLPGVKESAVVGVPHQLYGEMTWAFIVKKEGCDLEIKDIMKHCRSGLVNYMVPDQMSFIEEIPKNSGVGKVNYEKLKEIANNELLNITGGSHE
ncbi:class I adenylate-forming enzyme family protein [Acetivibrio cellulolyticus]|uniref:class I adenylate-forming enzyme family protein n=1 Tax=Acetivibrio cellulolyticus TaxID=35830 RepID=UPI0001E2C728|nr:class I adenylate-forming enzyme family protein [Acetivibrio cellulolyticus]